MLEKQFWLLCLSPVPLTSFPAQLSCHVIKDGEDLIRTKQLTEQTGTWDIHETTSIQERAFGNDFSVCSDGRTKVSQRKLARRQVQKNQISFSSHLHCCSLQDAVEASNFTWFQKEKELSKFMEMKRIIISIQSYYSSTAPGSGSFPLQNSGTVFWGDCLVLLQLLMEKRQWTEFLIWAGPATLIS